MPYTRTACLCAGAAGVILRRAYEKEFGQDDTLKEWARLVAPRKRTKKSSVAAGMRVESGGGNIDMEAYRAVDIFTRLLWYHDKNKHVLYDNAHQFANVLKQMMNSIKNRTKKDKLHFNNKIRAVELKLGGSPSPMYDTAYVCGDGVRSW
jgi:hypothetical protein